MLYYLEDPDIQRLISERYNYKLTSVSSKNVILKKLYPDIKLRTKTHGFERLLGFNGEVYNTLRSKTILRLEPSLDGIFIPDLILQLKGEV
jgi:hypothetical protein